jgi:DtxR family Mn-dependent transcriptional regulator
MSDLVSPTARERDYLVQIYRLSDTVSSTPGYVSTSALAELINVSAPAVNRMVTRLRDMHMLEHEPYQGIRLTDEGKREALKQLRRHRIVEAFLTTVMGFGWHEVHAEADQISRALTEVVADRMAEMAGNPTHCPHGEPIPTRDGDLPEMGDVLLADAPHNQPLILTRVRTREPDRLEYLAALQLVPGAHLEVIHAAPFHGPIQLKMGREYRIIGHNLAETIRVKPAD